MKVFNRLLLIIFLTTLFFITRDLRYQINKPSISRNQPKAQSAQISPCHINGVLPDSNCTPGVNDQNVTQENIYQTICTRGYTKGVRPILDYTEKLKTEQIQEYGYTDRNLRDYEEDHLIPLELGGNPSDPKNLWPEPLDSAHKKDNIENLCNKKVCNGKLDLGKAQRDISTNWQTACQ